MLAAREIFRLLSASLWKTSPCTMDFGREIQDDFSEVADFAASKRYAATRRLQKVGACGLA
jgi:hypothetical protein